MGFSWWCKDKHGKDLFGEFGVHYQALGLGANCPDDTPSEYRVSDIRSAWADTPYKEKLQEAAQDAVGRAQAMAQSNKANLAPHHCASCTCKPTKPGGWSVEEINKLLSVPIGRVWRAGGGY